MIGDGTSKKEMTDTFHGNDSKGRNDLGVVISDRDLLDRILTEIIENRSELNKLRHEMNANFENDRQRISELEGRGKSFGRVVNDRVADMLDLLSAYGGSMTSSMIKKKMILSKDEFYRTVSCAKNEGLIEVLPNPKDRRGYIVQINKTKIEQLFSSLSKNSMASK